MPETCGLPNHASQQLASQSAYVFLKLIRLGWVDLLLLVVVVCHLYQSLNTFPMMPNLTRNRWHHLVRWVTFGQQISHSPSHSAGARLPCSLLLRLFGPQPPSGSGGITSAATHTAAFEAGGTEQRQRAGVYSRHLKTCKSSFLRES